MQRDADLDLPCSLLPRSCSRPVRPRSAIALLPRSQSRPVRSQSGSSLSCLHNMVMHKMSRQTNQKSIKSQLNYHQSIDPTNNQHTYSATPTYICRAHCFRALAHAQCGRGQALHYSTAPALPVSPSAIPVSLFSLTPSQHGHG